jgi:hypothetical protein
MTIAARTGFLGLVTNIACVQSHEGALQIAQNVVCRRAGAIEPRDGVRELHSTADQASYGFSLDGETDVLQTWDGTNFAWEVASGAAIQYTDAQTGAEDPQPFRRDVFSHAALGGASYVPTDRRLLALDTASAFRRAGLPVVVYVTGGATASGGAFLANNEQVAYRVVTRKTTSTGLVIRSAPTGAVTVANTTGGAARVDLSLWFANDFYGDFDAAEVYRTRNFATSTTVDDEMQLVASVDRTLFALFGSNRLYTLADNVAATSRGATLYTSPSRGGISQQNDCPPAAAVVAAFKGSLFFGNVRGPQTIAFSLNYIGAAASGVATGIGERTYTGDTTIGVNQITNLSSTTGLERGMVVTGGSVPVNTYVTAISGTTATLNNNAGATGTGASYTFTDAVNIDGKWIQADIIPTGVVLRAIDNYETFSVTPPAGGSNRTRVVRTFSRAAGAATIQATHGGEYTPPLPTYADTPLELSQDVWPGGLMWSKQDEPEHVAPINYAFVGDKNRAILGIVPTRDALFILKEDGVFRLTGSSAISGWRIDPYDPTTRCVLPSSVKALNGRAYFLANRGVVAFDDSGAQLLSDPIHDLVRDLIDQVQDNFVEEGLYEQPGVVGSTAAIFERESEYTLLRGDEDDALVFNESRRAWTTWKYAPAAGETLDLRALFNFERDGRVCYALGNTTVYATRLSTDDYGGVLTLPLRADRDTDVTAVSYSAGSGTVTLGASVTVLADDVIQDAAGKLWRIENSATSNTHVVSGPSAAFTTGACILYRSLRCSVAPQTFYGPPMLAKDSSPLTATFSRFQGPVALSYLYSSQLSPLEWGSWEELDISLLTPNGYAAHTRGAAFPQDVGNDHRRAWLLDAAVRWAMSHGTVRLEGVYIEQRPMASPRVKQQVAG